MKAVAGAVSVIAVMFATLLAQEVAPEGKGVVLPTVVRQVQPQYTPSARSARSEGTVVLDVVVQKDGTVGAVKVKRSLDSKHGLDQQAVKAAKQWLFTPGTKAGRPVPVTVTIEMKFTMHS
jgi:protein TonB